MPSLALGLSGQLWIDLAYGAIVLALGLPTGWWLRHRREGSGNADTQRAQAVLGRVQELAAHVAEDVGQHTSRVREINTELAAAQAAGGSALEQLVVTSLANLVKANEQLQERLQSAEEKLQQQSLALQTQAAEARTDAVTCTYNRRALDDELQRRISEWQRRRTTFSLVMLDIDCFKKFNDQHGHQAGDHVLRGVARTLAQTLRDMDFVARYGGEEFALLLPSTNLEEGIRAAERCRLAAADAEFTVDAKPLRVSISLGVAEVGDGDDARALLRRADEALYAAKHGGRNCTYFHDGQSAHPATPAAGAAAVEIPAPEAADAAGLPPEMAAFQTDLQRRVTECQRFGVPLSLLILCLDNLAQLLATLGEVAARSVQGALHELLQGAVNEIDVVTPCGQGQFAVMMPGTDGEAAAHVADRLREVIAGTPLSLRGQRLELTASCGVAQVLPQDTSATLFDRATTALSAAQLSEANRTHVHDGQSCAPLALPPLLESAAAGAAG